MQLIHAKTYDVVFGQQGYNHINRLLTELNPSSIFVLVDENTHEHCLPSFLPQIETTATIEILEIESGEINKTIDSCVSLWNVLTELNADRQSLLIHLGGGVITDMGGFIASTYKRGINFINVPTTLLSMVDASVGGKTGVDLNELKNQIGVINTPKTVLIDINFLETLNQRQFNSGLAEMYKHGLIQNKTHWEQLQNQAFKIDTTLEELIYSSVAIKNEVVLQDLTEQNIRKILNFGHTLGHAIETYLLKTEEPLLHGEAIGIGMILEAYLSHKLLGFSETDLTKIKTLFKQLYIEVKFKTDDINAIIKLLKFDKKNSHGNINFVLLKAIGTPEIDCKVPEDLIYDAFNYYAL